MNNPPELHPDILAYLEAFHALDTVADDLDQLAETQHEMSQDETNAENLLEIGAMVAEDKADILARRDYTLRSFIGSAATRANLTLAAGLYLDEHVTEKQGHFNTDREAIERVRSYAALITLTQYQGAVPDFGGAVLARTSGSRTAEVNGRAVRLHGVEDTDGRGLWVNICDPRGVEIISAASEAEAALGGEAPETAEAPVGKITGTYDVLALYEHADGSRTVTVVPASTDQAPFTVHVVPGDRTWVLNKNGLLLHAFIPEGATSVSDISSDMEVFHASEQSEAAEVAVRAAGGPQRSIFETFDTTNRRFNPVAVPTGKRN